MTQASYIGRVGSRGRARHRRRRGGNPLGRLRRAVRCEFVECLGPVELVTFHSAGDATIDKNDETACPPIGYRRPECRGITASDPESPDADTDRTTKVVMRTAEAPPNEAGRSGLCPTESPAMWDIGGLCPPRFRADGQEAGRQPAGGSHSPHGLATDTAGLDTAAGRPAHRHVAAGEFHRATIPCVPGLLRRVRCRGSGSGSSCMSMSRSR